jgi:Trk K+ transport system NAD-binding subunit
MLMATLGPLVFNRMVPLPEEEFLPPIVVTNAGRMGLEVAEQLRRHGEPVLLIDPDPTHISKAVALGFDAIEGYVDRPDDRVQPHLDIAEKFVTTYTEVDVNYQICRFVRTTYGIPHVVAEVTNPSDMSRFKALGVTATNPTLDRTALMALITRSPGSYYMMTRTNDDQETHEVTMRNPSLIGRALREVHLPPELLVIAIQRHGELIVPHGDTRLEQGDSVTVLGPAGHATQTYHIFATHYEPSEFVSNGSSA